VPARWRCSGRRWRANDGLGDLEPGQRTPAAPLPESLNQLETAELEDGRIIAVDSARAFACALQACRAMTGAVPL
jgi:hypothetical protein